jgi:hypothetical protein
MKDQDDINPEAFISGPYSNEPERLLMISNSSRPKSPACSKRASLFWGEAA